MTLCHILPLWSSWVNTDFLYGFSVIFILCVCPLSEMWHCSWWDVFFSPGGVIVKALNCSLKVSEFKLVMLPLVKGMNLLIAIVTGQMVSLLFFNGGWLWHYITHEGWYAIKLLLKIQWTNSYKNLKKLFSMCLFWSIGNGWC